MRGENAAGERECQVAEYPTGQRRKMLRGVRHSRIEERFTVLVELDAKATMTTTRWRDRDLGTLRRWWRLPVQSSPVASRKS
jgi:hypothetical protein